MKNVKEINDNANLYVKNSHLVNKSN